jgi:elongation factor P hydroxylase
VYAEQLQFKHDDKVNAKKDLEDGVYHSADIYTLSARTVAGEEKRKLENRMRWVLTGGEEHWQDSKAIGREAGVQKKIEDAELRMQSTTRIKKKKGKTSHFYKRPNRTKNE